MQDAIDRLFRGAFGAPPAVREPLDGDGSRRRMIRLRAQDGATAVAVVGPDPLENRAFLSFSAAFRKVGLPVPEVFAADEEAGVYLLEDLGDTTLFDALQAGREEAGGAFPAAMLPVYRRVLEWLPRFQVEGGRAVDYDVAYPRARYDAQGMRWDCNYFKYDFLKLAHVPFHEARLEVDFAALIAWLGQAPGNHFVYRDLQSRNVMLREGEPWFIDYQGGMQGPLQVDVAKLLYESKAGIPPEIRAELLEHYLQALGAHVRVDRRSFLAHFRGFVVLRLLQGLGAYGLLGLHEGKPQFVARIPHAVRDVGTLLADGFLPIELPELRAVLERLATHDVLRALPPPPGPGLTVRVGSFSYKRGMPRDPGGHGGGYVFDCRALPNPGRLAEHATRTGLDDAVAGWLESQPACGPFFEAARALVEAQVEAYGRRGFSSLQVLFGCTGGQHRSPYFAERLGRALRARFPDVGVRVEHAERARWPAPAERNGA